MTLNQILSHFEGVKGGGGQYMARCPCHNDKHQSLSIAEGDKGIVMNCHAGCGTRDILDRVGLKQSDLFYEERPKRQPTDKPHTVAIYNYPNGAQKVRRSDKSFIWRQPDDQGGWKWSRKGLPRVLYQRGELSSPVLIAEGEKDVDNLHKLGFDAVSGEDGAGPGKWHKEYTQKLAGKQVVIFPDNDEVGREYAQEVATALSPVCPVVKLVDLSAVWPEIPEHGDVSDLITTFGSNQAAEMITGLMLDAPEWEPQKEEIDESAPALVSAAEIPYEPPKWLLAPYFQVGKGTLIQGDAGTGKTAFMCAVAAHVSTGTPLLGLEIEKPGAVLILSIEDDLPVLRGRIEADGGDMTKCYFIKNGAGLTFNSPIIETYIKQVGAKLIIFDPFQAFLGAGVDMFRSNETRPELAKLFEMCERNDCACAIIAHMGKSGGDKSPVNRSLGSVDIPAAMRSILQLIRNPENEDECIMVHVKSSNAPRGRSLAYTIGHRGGVHWTGFSNMTVEDLGSIVKRKEKGVKYDQEPLVQVLNQLITDRPGGGFWSYEDVRIAGAKILGFPPFGTTAELKARLEGPLSRELQQKDGLIVTVGHRGHNGVRGIRIEQYKIPGGYQTTIPG